ncbi:MAG: glycosyltransferase [Bacteroidetes bacterium]|nr:glycosyltransferase [Bacteroidota bacterium]
MNKEKKSTILFITTGLNTGGAEMMLYNLVSVIGKAKYFPVVISLIPAGDIGKKLIDLGIDVYSLNVQPGKLPSVPALIKLIRLVRKIQPAIIHGWMYHGNLAATFVKFFLWRKNHVLWTIHHSIDSLKNEKKSTSAIIKLGAKLSRFPSSVIYVSSVGKKQHESLGYSSSKSIVIPNAVDTDLFFPSQENKTVVRKELELSEDVFLVGNIARFHPMKDHENFFKAAALVLQRYPNTSFVLSGANVDAANNDLKEKIDSLNIPNIKLLGARSDVDKILSAIDVLVVSSSHGEAFPMIILEAMSSGILCVSTDIGDVRGIIGDIGKIVPAKNAWALAKAIEEIIELNETQRKKMQAVARQKILANYSLQQIAGKYEKLYEKYLSS